MLSADADSGADSAVDITDEKPAVVVETDAAGASDVVVDFGGDSETVSDPDTEAAAETASETVSAEEPFFGMRSEGMALTGVALGPGLRSGAKVCLAATLGLGVLFWVVLALLYTDRVFFQSAHANPEMPHLPDGRPWTAYYLIGALWAVGVGVFGLLTRGSFARLVWCFSCLVTAFLWPLGMAASFVVLAVRRVELGTARRVALVGLAVLVAVGGSVWRFTAPSNGAQQVAVGSDGDLLGTWKSRTGMSVELRGDGTYDASALSGGGLRSGDGVPASSGRWDSESTDGHSGVRLQVNGDLANSLWFDVYKAGPDLLLCSTDDPGSPCQVVLRRI